MLGPGLADVEAGQVLRAAPLLELHVPLGDLVPDPLEPVPVSAAHSEVLLRPHALCPGVCRPPLPRHILLSEALAPHQAVAAGEAASLLDLLPPLGQRHWRRHPD